MIDRARQNKDLCRSSQCRSAKLAEYMLGLKNQRRLSSTNFAGKPSVPAMKENRLLFLRCKAIVQASDSELRFLLASKLEEQKQITSIYSHQLK